MNKKNVAIINSVCNFGSTGRISYEFSSYLKNKTNINSKVYYGRGKKDHDNYKFSNRLFVFINALFCRIFDCDGRLSFLSTFRLIRRLKRDNVSLIVLNNIHGYYLNYKLLFNYIKKHNIKLIWIFHDCWNITGHCAHFDYIGCDKYKTLCYKCPNKKEYPKSYFFDNSKRNFLSKRKCFSTLSKDSTVIVSPSKWLASKINSSFLKEYKCIVINNGIDTNIFKNIKSTNLKKPVNILCIANVWTEKKGFSDVLRLNKMIDHTKYQIVMVGKIKTKKVLPANIIKINQTNSSLELAELYNNSLVVFNPTYEDTYSNVNMEALSCGCNVICYNTGGAIEMLDKECIVEKGDVEKAYSIIERINPNNVRVRKYDFSKYHSYEKYLDIILELLSMN